MPFPHWITRHDGIALRGSRGQAWSLAELAQRTAAVAALFDTVLCRERPLGLIADNGPQWIAVDLAAHMTGVTLIPLPAFFTGEQLAHAACSTGMQALLCADAALARSLGFESQTFTLGRLGMFVRAPVSRPPALPDPGAHIQKISFTSGTTGAPKGVCLTPAQQLQAARALVDRMVPLGIDRHLSVLPMPVLLENIAGVYAALMLGATCICPDLDEVGLPNASGFAADRLLRAIAEYAPESLILLPQMLAQLVVRLEADGTHRDALARLRFVAVGGAHTPTALIARARRLGLPVYEGYGLTECGSVVALNIPAADRAGSVGRPVPGIRVRLAADGEIELHGRSWAGYLGAPQTPQSTWFATGDLGTVDTDGYLSIVGRKKNIYITSFGRNVSPEWPESLLLESPCIAQAAVYGEARAHAVAIIVAASEATRDCAIEQAVARANRRLPDYARIGGWVRAEQAFCARNGLATANGRMVRTAIHARYRDRIELLYATHSETQP